MGQEITRADPYNRTESQGGDPDACGIPRVGRAASEISRNEGGGSLTRSLGFAGAILEQIKIVRTPRLAKRQWVANVLEENIPSPFMILEWGRHL